MKNKWHKHGVLYAPSGNNRHPKLLTHAANPLPILIEGDIYRVFFSGRDAINRSSVGAVDIDIVKRKVIREHEQPFFEHGQEGSFYADGLSLGNCYEVDGIKYMLFMGWQNPKVDHWRGDIGRLIVKPDLTLELDRDIPFMSSNRVDSVSLSYPWVIQVENKGYHMWYGSTVTWDAGNGEMLHVINHASSDDGHHWVRNGLAVPYQLGVAQAFSRPTVVKNSEGLQMWFSYRSGNGEKYRIGHAVNKLGDKWELSLENPVVKASVDEDWESEMVEYPFVFNHEDELYMLYNGNEYGKTGFGLALLEQN